MSSMVELKLVKPSDLEPNPRQPRTQFDEEKLKQMADSIRDSGLLQPIIVRQYGGKYQIVAGERRWRAAKLAGVEKIPVLVRETTDKRLLLESLVENLHREDLTSIEREDAIYELWNSGEFSSQRNLAKALGYVVSTVSEIIESKEFRDRVGVRLPNTISTHAIADTQGLDDATRLKLLQKTETGEIETGYHDAELTELVRVLKKAPEPFKEALIAGEIEVQRAKEALQVYEEVKKETKTPVDDQNIVQYVEELKSAQREEEREKQIRRNLARDALTGGAKKEPQQELHHWAEELETDPPSTQTANWWKWNLTRSGKKFDFYTTHYSQKDIATFVEILKAAGVKTVIDVRYNPVSQFNPEYSKSNLKAELKAKGVNYVHAPELGVPREQRDKLAHTGDWNTFFEWYDSNIIPKLNQVLEGEKLKESDKPYAFLCVEVDPTKCHRHRIALAYEKQGLRGLDL